MHGVSDSGPFDDDDLPEGFDFSNLFGGMGNDPNAMMASFMSLFGGGLPGASGGLDQATQLAVAIASGGQAEANVDPTVRMSLEQLARVAELQIAQVTGLRTGTNGPVTIAPVTRGEWVKRSMQAYKPVLEQLAAAMATPVVDDELGSDPQMAMFQQLFSSLRPMMVNMTTGSMVGHLGSRALGTYDLPLPRPGSDELLVVVPNLDAFGEEWSLAADGLQMWIALSEVAYHAVLSVPHVAQRISALLGRYTNAFRNDPSAVTDSLAGFDFNPNGDFAEMQEQLQSMLGDPSALLGAMRSPEQDALLPEISVLMATIVGYVDHVMDQVGSTLITDYSQLTEALRRRRVTASESDRFVERLLGLELTQDVYDRGRAFADGVFERAGSEGLNRVWESEESLPTPNELDAPGLWLARMGIEFEMDIDPSEFDLSEFEDPGDTDSDDAD
jgi:putative hydrolase